MFQPHYIAVIVLVVIGMLVGSYGTPSTAAATQAEVEPNNTSATATSIPALGLGEVTTGAINPANDTDYFRFSAVGGRAYVIELLNAEGSLGIDGNFSCTNFAGAGLGIIVYNSSGTGVVLTECIAYNNGSGNVHNIAVFRPASSGFYYIRLQHNNSTATGAYALRILPGYANPGAAWDSVTFEPNNRAPNAYLLPLGRSLALTSAFEPIDENYSSYTPDTDWYRFSVVSGREYSVEVYNVASALSTSSSSTCDRFGRVRRGVWLTIYKTDENEVLRQCETPGSGNVHTIATFKAEETGIYYASVRPHGLAESGSYSIRVLPKYEQPGADWDSATFEPNNTAIIAYAFSTGRANAITSTISERDPAFATTEADVDWYRFEVVNGVEYTVETLNVAPGLAAGAGTACDSFGRTTRGLTVAVFTDSEDQVGRTCNAENVGGVHSSFTFTAGYDGIYYARILPNDNTTSGVYSLRIRSANDVYQVALPLVKR